MEANQIRIATVIVSYKSERQTADYITKELSKCHIPQIIVVVNNASTTDSCNKLIKLIGGGGGFVI